MSFQTSALILSWIAILLLAFTVSGLVRQVHALSSGAVQRRPESVGLRPGTPAPGIARLAPAAPTVPLVLLFLAPDCGTCTEVLAEATDHHERPGLEFRVLYREDPPARAAQSPITVLGGQAELFERYDAIATPFATVVDRAGRVLRAEPIGSRAALHRLLDEVDSPPGGSAPAGATNQGGRA
ncbi:hypothetical protein AB0I85_13805 [Micromonospora echinofusca]|uniref:hypothetical protein n=1 Tax=Micromonospora echinofusca TaxID=47858 RepID=UPI000CAADE7C|nr:hypothetical protein [Micromonospora sp. MSM11]MCL7461056.1 hypothetical protein [Micromonospora sp. MSM11]